jgi:mannitol-1-phosphate 5-dehydrogenase
VSLNGNRTFVGFGFGPIQAGLFLYEAFQSGAFRRLVVAEVLPQVVEAIRAARGHFTVNIAHFDRVERAEVGPIEIENPASAPDRDRLVHAVAEAAEISTAVPSVQHYVSAGPGSLHRLLAEGLRRKASNAGPLAVVYAAENHNHAAEILEAKVFEEVPPAEHTAVRARARFLNTVIGKMSGTVSDAEQVRAQGLATITGKDSRAFLVEAFNRILISKIHYDANSDGPRFERGIRVFEEKEDLLPFEEAKLYGHNATHALAAYVGAARGAKRIAELADLPDVMDFLRAAFIRESGEALIRRHRGVDALFTPEGYREYAEDLLARMVNPYLMDTIERVGRDPERKLGWDDRLVGTMRVALRVGVRPARYAFGAAAALALLDPSTLGSKHRSTGLLDQLWCKSQPEEGERRAVVGLIEEGQAKLRQWREAGFPNLENVFN